MTAPQLVYIAYWSFFGYMLRALSGAAGHLWWDFVVLSIEQRDFSKKNVIILNYLLQTIILGGWTSRSLRNTVDFLDTETLILNLLLDGRWTPLFFCTTSQIMAEEANPNGYTKSQQRLVEVWEEHMKCEFATKNVEDTMITMVEDTEKPFVNHVPTLTGGVGREQISEFYAKYFIPQVSS